MHGEKGRRVKESLPENGERRGERGVPNGLQVIHAEIVQAEQRHADKADRHDARAQGENGLVLHEQPGDRHAQRVAQRGQRRAGENGEQPCFPDDLPCARRVARAVVVGDHRLYAEAERHRGHGDDHAGLSADAHCGDDACAVPDRDVVCDRVGHAHQEVADRAGHAEPQHLQEYSLIPERMPRVQRERRASAAQVEENRGGGEQIADDRRNGGAPHAHAESGDKERVERDVGGGAEPVEQHGFLDGALGTHEVCEGAGKHDGRRAGGEHEQVVLCELQGGAVRTEEAEKGVRKQERGAAEQHAARKAQHNARAGADLGAGRVSGAERRGNRRAATAADQRAERHLEQEKGRSQRDRRHLRGISGLPDENQVRHVVGDGDEHHGDGGDAHPQDGPPHGALFKKFGCFHTIRSFLLCFRCAGGMIKTTNIALIRA